MQYRKKPVVIDAFLWTGGPDQIEDPVWIVQAIKDGKVGFSNTGNTLLINTLEGVMTAQKGDYIIKGVEGEIYPCKLGIFEKTYEPVS